MLTEIQKLRFIINDRLIFPFSPGSYTSQLITEAFNGDCIDTFKLWDLGGLNFYEDDVNYIKSLEYIDLKVDVIDRKIGYVGTVVFSGTTRVDKYLSVEITVDEKEVITGKLSLERFELVSIQFKMIPV